MINRPKMIKEILDFTSKYGKEELGIMSDRELLGLHSEIMIKKSLRDMRKKLGLQPNLLLESMNWEKNNG